MPSLQRLQAVIQPTPKTADNNRAGGAFVQVSVELLRDNNLSSAALKLYLILLAYCGSKTIAWPSQNRLAQDMHLSERRVRGLLVELEETGLVAVKHCSGSSNTYIVQRHSQTEDRQQEEKNCRVARKNISDHVHEAESINMCEGQTVIGEAEVETEKVKELESLFVSAGMSGEMALELVRIIHQNNRDICYVKSLVEVSQRPNVHNPIGFIRFMVLRNAEPSLKVKSSKANPGPKGKSLTQPPLDFAKYTSGKYAYLTRPVTQPVVEILAVDEEIRPAMLSPIDRESRPNHRFPPESVEKKPPAGVKSELSPEHLAPWSKPAYISLRHKIADIFKLEGLQVLRDWEDFLEDFSQQPIVSYFCPALGWLENHTDRPIFRLVFRNKFDRRLGERHLGVLARRLAERYGQELELVTQDFTT